MKFTISKQSFLGFHSSAKYDDLNVKKELLPVTLSKPEQIVIPSLSE
jgi:hypothetical protein